MKINDLKNKSVLILGMGREGLSTYYFLRRLFPIKKIGVTDVAYNPLKKEELIDPYIGTNYLKSLQKYEIVIKSPGITPYRKEIQDALHDKNKIITCQTELFFDNFDGKIIGVTGTKGKSTISSMIYHLLKTAGYSVKLGGNIGKPPLELLNLKSTIKNRVGVPSGGIPTARNANVSDQNLINNQNNVLSSNQPHEQKQMSTDGRINEGQVPQQSSWVVLELSSHQLWNLKKSPHIAVFLNIYPEHLDYSSFEEYFNAKTNITKYQYKEDYFIYNRSFPALFDLAKRTKAQSLHFGPIKTPEEQNKSVIEIIAKILSISNGAMKQSINSFVPLPGRLENIGTFKEITFYDDYLATIPEATINALNTFKNKIGTMFLGGWERKQDFSQVIKEVVAQKIPLIILFPPTGTRIKNQLSNETMKQFTPRFELVNDMKEAVNLVYKYCPKGKIALFSTGAPSFGMYKDYHHRSRQFRYWVRKLGQS